MIENLDGIHETVNYRDHSSIKLYDNTDFEAYPTHWHSCVEIIMPVKNTYTVEYDKASSILQEGEILFLCGGALHRVPACEGERYILQAEINPFHQIKGLEETMTRFYPAVLISPETTPDAYEKVHSLFLEIVDEYPKKNTTGEILMYARILEMIRLIGQNHSHIQPHFPTGNIKQKEYTEIFMSICDYISEHCDENLSLDSVAAISGFSKYHFSRLFKQYTNYSFYKYLNIKRIARAEQLLIDPSLSITEVALSSGFPSHSSFIRMFKIIKGCTPSEFRSIYDL